MYKSLNIIIFVLSLFFFLTTAPTSYAACCPTSDISCSYPNQCQDPSIACTSPEECPSNTVCDVSRAPNASQSQFDVRYCIGSSSRETIENIYSVRATCRRVSDTAWNAIVDLLPDSILGVDIDWSFLKNNQVCACHDDGWSAGVAQNTLCALANTILGTSGYNLAVDSKTFDSLPIGQDPNTGIWYTCFNFQSAIRQAGEVEIDILDRDGNTVCSSRVDTKPKDYSHWESLDALLGINIYEDATERDPYDLKCSTVEGKEGVNTAFGCIATQPTGFTRDFLTISIGIGGGIALLLLLYAATLISLSRGNPQKIQSGQQIIAAVIQGLILITLSVVMLNFLGINILNLPGLQ